MIRAFVSGRPFQHLAVCLTLAVLALAVGCGGTTEIDSAELIKKDAPKAEAPKTETPKAEAPAPAPAPAAAPAETKETPKS